MSILGTEIEEDERGIDGADIEDVVGAILGAARRRRGPPLMRKPAWRRSELAPGVNTADEGLEPLPFIPQANNGVFSATFLSIIFQGTIQKPFRGERWIASVVRTGASATGLLLSQLFVGTSLQQADIVGIDIQQLGNPQAFGVRMAMFQATPGVLVRLPVTISAAPTGTDNVFLSLFCMGRVIHS